LETPQTCILLITDNPKDVRLLSNTLIRMPDLQYRLVHADHLSSALANLAETRFDIVLLELNLPDCRELDTYHIVKSRIHGAPLIVLLDPTQTLPACQVYFEQVKQDFLSKADLQSHLFGILLRTIVANLRTAGRLQDSEERFRKLVENAADYAFQYDSACHLTMANRSLSLAMRLPMSEMLGKSPAELGFPDEIAQEWQELIHLVLAGEKVETITKTPMPDGQVHTFLMTLHPLYDPAGCITGVTGLVHEIRDPKHAEEAIK
jgi:PAS domain S-box-containing protein